ncbi:hypothetical protein ZHAS_00018723 [Anopheles sinensis]|uniref:Uncharacterized protein n=1 Tax=Anopheles sinensis TaxID=74873 RepID=A0A084WKE1_ANOSI|nr:hypothetical protein ZHAS_00018723 [Anopheles sinensis]
MAFPPLPQHRSPLETIIFKRKNTRIVEVLSFISLVCLPKALFTSDQTHENGQNLCTSAQRKGPLGASTNDLCRQPPSVPPGSRDEFHQPRQPLDRSPSSASTRQEASSGWSVDDRQQTYDFGSGREPEGSEPREARGLPENSPTPPPMQTITSRAGANSSTEPGATGCLIYLRVLLLISHRYRLSGN